MNNRFFFGILLILIASQLSAGGSGEKEEKPPSVQVKGLVRLTGTSLFPEIVISGDEMEWHVAQDEYGKLKDFQHRIVTIEGEQAIIEMEFAKGRFKSYRRELRNIRIIAVE
ncbi:MAG: hypothetical protein LBH16_06630 [Treponema sp.]|jgi:hypothetical protein|nr:hypothetical protein [Treponema sp.]